MRTKVGEKAICKYCNDDIEFIGSRKWWDRGGNKRCNDGKHYHQPIKIK